MKSNRKDTILNAAFDGDTNVESLSGEERAELLRLKSLKAALLGLKDVPECQLSNERLRNAILDKGVKRKSTFGWTAMVATAACAVVVVLVASQQRSGQIDQRVSVGVSPDAPTVNAVPDLPIGLIDSVKKDQQFSVTATAPSERKQTDSITLGSSEPKKVVAMRSRNDSSVEIVSASLTSEPTNDQGAVVVVDSANTTENGSYEAVELEAFGDVVFGG